nr:replication protein A 70 kDa DNA-binding subunit B-like [Ipomoea batatas]
MEGFVLIPDVTTESRQWRCKVAVVQKLNTQESRRTPGKKYKPIILQDEAGNRVQAMVYDNDIDGLDKRLEVSSTYIICNASVTNVVGFKNLPDPKYTNLWNITRSTMIQKVSPDEAIDMSGHVHDHLSKFHQVFDYFLSRQPIRLSLGTRYNTSIEVDPVNDGAKVLNDWKDKNSELIYKAIVDKSYLDSLLTLADLIGQRKTCLSALEAEFEQKPIAWVRGKIILLKRDVFDYYVGCNYCNRAVHSTEGLQLQCMNCGHIDSITVRRYKMDIEIFDNVGSVRATMFSHEVHRLMLLASSNIPTCENEGAMLQQTLDNLDLVFGLKKNTIFSERTTKYTLACLCNDVRVDLGESNDGITLSTRYDTTIEVNPSGQHSTVLNEWKANNLSVISKTIVDKTYLDSFLTLSNPLQQPICTFVEIADALKETPVAWVRGKLRMKNIGPIEYYIGCYYCNKAVKDIEGLKLDCLYCGQTDGITVRRYGLNVEISDGSTILQATLFNHDVHRLMLLFGIEMPTTVKESEIFQQKLDSTDFVVDLRKNALNEDQSFSLTYSVACICKAITRDSCVQQQTPHACSSNIVEETFLVRNPTKRRLDLDGSLKHAINIIEDDTSEQKSASQDKGKRPRVGYTSYPINSVCTYAQFLWLVFCYPS